MPAESGLVCRVRNRHAVGAGSTDSTIHVGLGVTQVAEFSHGHGRSVQTNAGSGGQRGTGPLAASFGVALWEHRVVADISEGHAGAGSSGGGPGAVDADVGPV